MTSIRKRAQAASTPAVRRVMQANVGRQTAPERALEQLLLGEGLHFGTDKRPVPELRCKADVVLRIERVCVFIDGCYWHGSPEHFASPKTNRAWWVEKIADNRARDERQSRQPRARGWAVLRLWEHEMRDLEGVKKKVLAKIRTRRRVRR